MAQIELENVEKAFVVRRKRGRVLRERTVVQAVAGISFEIEAGRSSAISARTAPASRPR